MLDMWKSITKQERKPTAVKTWDTLFNNQQGVFYMHHPTDRISIPMPLLHQLWMEQEIAQLVHYKGSI